MRSGGGKAVIGGLTVFGGKVEIRGGKGGEGGYGGEGGRGVSGGIAVHGGVVSATGGEGGLGGLGDGKEEGGVFGDVTYDKPLIGQDSDDGETWAKLESGEQSTKRYVRAGHFHAISYAADGAAVTATCTAAACWLGGVAELTIGAPPAAIDGAGGYEATIHDPDGIRGGAEVAYYRASGGERAGDALEAAPTGTGAYRAEITLGEGDGAATAHVEYMLPRPPWAGSGTQGDPFVIADADGWDELARLVGDGLDTTGMHFELGADISVSTMVGPPSNPFRGSFDGAGHTLTFDVTTDKEDCAPFLYVSDAAFENLRIAGTIATSSKCAAGLASISTGFTTVTDCVSDVDIVSAVDGDGTHGGFVAVAGDRKFPDGRAVFEGCAFTGSISGENTTSCGGFVGFDRGGSTCANCVLDATVATKGGTATFVRRSDAADGCLNSYYTKAVGQGRDHGKPAQAVALPEGVSVAGGAAATYGVSGIEAYGTGLGYGGAVLAAEGETLRLAADGLADGGGKLVVGGVELGRDGDAWVLVVPEGGASVSRIESIGGAEIALSKKSFTYSGKKQVPKVVTVKGLALKEGTDYDVSYSKGGKAVKSPKDAEPTP